MIVPLHSSLGDKVGPYLKKKKKKSSFSNYWLTCGSSVQTLTAYRIPRGFCLIAWERESKRTSMSEIGYSHYHSARTWERSNSFCSMGNQRWQTKFNSGLRYPHCSHQASPALMVEPHGEEHVLGRDPFVTVLCCSLQWVRAHTPFVALLLILDGREYSWEPSFWPLAYPTHSLLLVEFSEGKVHVLLSC